jgi:hypothetical protein
MTNDKLFREDATFCLREGLYDKNEYSFEAINFPNYYIRHVNFEIRLEPFDGSMQFKKDATFYLREPISPPGRFD